MSGIGWVAFYDYFNSLEIYKENTKIAFEKYKKFILSGIFMSIYFEGVAIFCRRPCICNKDEQGKLHSLTSPAISWRDGYSLYFINGVCFEKKWWSKIVNDEMTPEEIFAIDNVEHRRIAYEYMDKLKMKSLKDFKILDEQIDEKGKVMKIVSFTVQKMTEPLKFYNCIDASTDREYFLGTDCNDCKSAKESLWGLKDIEFVNEW